ncbi:MAG: rRNA adenine N-6-methyltransferase family protein [Nanoarchaeota archaeon]
MSQDQHFMIDKEVLEEIAEAADLLGTDRILEIGAGHGELTRKLCKKAYTVAVELDSELVKAFPELENLKLVKGNVLQVWKDHLFNKVVGNIPYAISEPLLWLILKKPLERVVLVLGKDFSDILLSDSKLGVLAREFYEVEVVRKIPKKAFFPAPSVDSVLILMKPKKAENILLRELVLQSDKKIKNALETVLERKTTKRELKEKVQVLGKIVDKGITQLSNEEFAELLKFLTNL